MMQIYHLPGRTTPMSTTRTDYKYIVLDSSGEAFIEGTRYKVLHLVKDNIAYGWSPLELQWQHPDLSLAQVHSALAYYADHQNEIDDEIKSDLDEYRALKARTGPSIRPDLERRVKF